MSVWSLRWPLTSPLKGHLTVLKVAVCHTAGHYVEEYDDWNRLRWNCSSDGAERTDDRRTFHARAAVTGKAWSPSVVRRVDGMTIVDVEALRRRLREPTLAVKWKVSARYDGAVPIRQRYTRAHNRNWILSGTFSQCSSRRSGVMCSDFLAENTRRAASLKTDFSCCNSCPEIPERTERCERRTLCVWWSAAKHALTTAVTRALMLTSASV